MSITLENVTISYQGQPAVEALSGSFLSGEATAICGPNGAGKSTLLKALAGMLPLNSGTIDWGAFNPHKLAYLPQQANIDRQALPLSLTEFVSSGLWREYGAFRRIDEAGLKRIALALERVGLACQQNRAVSALSVGQFQRALFARILVQEASLILLDEPFNAVDAQTTSDLLALVADWHQEKKTVIAVLHDFDQVRACFPYVLLLARTQVAWGETATVLTSENIHQAQAMMKRYAADSLTPESRCDR